MAPAAPAPGTSAFDCSAKITGLQFGKCSVRVQDQFGNPIGTLLRGLSARVTRDKKDGSPPTVLVGVTEWSAAKEAGEYAVLYRAPDVYNPEVNEELRISVFHGGKTQLRTAVEKNLAFVTTVEPRTIDDSAVAASEEEGKALREKAVPEKGKEEKEG